MTVQYTPKSSSTATFPVPVGSDRPNAALFRKILEPIIDTLSATQQLAAQAGLQLHTVTVDEAINATGSESQMAAIELASGKTLVVLENGQSYHMQNTNLAYEVQDGVAGGGHIAFGNPGLLLQTDSGRVHCFAEATYEHSDDEGATWDSADGSHSIHDGDPIGAVYDPTSGSNGRICVVTRSNTLGEARLDTSIDDGANWTRYTTMVDAAHVPNQNTAITGNLLGILPNLSYRLVAVMMGTSGVRSQYSDDGGATWTAGTNPAAGTGETHEGAVASSGGYVYYAGKVLAPATEGIRVWRTSDGLAWTEVAAFNGTANRTHHLHAFGNSLLLDFRLDGLRYLSVSTNGLSWSPASVVYPTDSVSHLQSHTFSAFPGGHVLMHVREVGLLVGPKVSL